MTEKERIQDTESWPLWPKLPVKKSQATGLPALGYLLADDVEIDDIITIFKGPVFTSSDPVVFTHYRSLDLMLEAGWVGD